MRCRGGLVNRNELICIYCSLRTMSFLVALFFFLFSLYLGRDKRKCAIEHLQNMQIQIILRMRKILSSPVIRLWHPVILLTDSEGPYQTADTKADLGLRCPHMPEDTFSNGRCPFNLASLFIQKFRRCWSFWSTLNVVR